VPTKPDFSRMHCSIARTLDLIGESWTLLIIRDVLQGARRFDDLQTSLGVATNTLTSRLKRLTDAGVLERRPYQDNPPRFEYGLTQKGRSLSPILLSLTQWGDTYLAGPEGPPRLIVHEPCGHLAAVKVVCTQCGSGIKAQDVRMVDAARIKQSPTKTGRR
jgi:DNA-binding HxlR family transcriptional regulator